MGTSKGRRLLESSGTDKGGLPQEVTCGWKPSSELEGKAKLGEARAGGAAGYLREMMGQSRQRPSHRTSGDAGEQPSPFREHPGLGSSWRRSGAGWRRRICPFVRRFRCILWVGPLFCLQPSAMWWTPLLLLLLLLLLSTAPRPSRAGPLQKAPVFQLTHQGPWGSGVGNATVSSCEGLPAAGVTTLTLANRGLERLPGCLPRVLRSLDGSHNLLRALSAPELGHLPRLQVLTLRHNRIAALRWGPGAPAGLHTLDLSYNLLEALPPCSGPVLPGLRTLALAGNPLRALQTGAFACFPALRLLNLSCTALGRGDHAGIADAAFTGAGGAPLAALEVLDLSGTFLRRGECGRPVSSPSGRRSGEKGL